VIALPAASIPVVRRWLLVSVVELGGEMVATFVDQTMASKERIEQRQRKSHNPK
jgi:hypothetical protein